MKLYVLETGCYGDRITQGVFSIPELAMGSWNPVRANADRTHTYEWTMERETLQRVYWIFDADFDHYAEVKIYELDEKRT